MANEDMKEGWNGASGAEWVRLHDRYDATLAAWADLIATTAAVSPGDRVLDIGCGNGVTTRRAARAAAPEGEAVGVDLSEPMLAQARKRAAEEGVANVDFRVADAQTDPLGAADSPYDVAVSRFGVMFFDDPVAAFANVNQAMRPGGRLAILSWAPMPEQQWLLVPMAAAREHVPPPPGFGGDGPGMFGLSVPEHITDVLTRAGWTDVDIQLHRRAMPIGGGGGVDDTMEYIVNGGPGRALLEGVAPDVAAKAIAAIRRSLDPHITDRGVELEGVTLMTTALASDRSG
jgi:SAM-dependent methyltransferase